MWIKEVTNGKGTRYKYSERFALSDGTHTTLSITLNSKSRHAQKEAAIMLQQKFNEKIITASQRKAQKLESLTMYQVFDEWLEQIKPTIRNSSFTTRCSQVNYIKSKIDKSMLFNEFTPNTAEKIIHHAFFDEDKSRDHVNNLLHIIKMTMRYAKKEGYIDNIQEFIEIKIPKRALRTKDVQKKNNKFLDMDELKDALQQLHKLNPRIALAMEFLSLTGLRCGEMVALRVEDYNKEAGTIDINGTIPACESYKNGIVRNSPKNIFSVRTVTLNARAKCILDSIILENKRRSLWNNQKYKDYGYIFTTKTGRPYRIVNINGVLAKIQIKGKQITTHVFRHTHISMLISMGIPLKAIMARVGHHNASTTLQIYTHITASMQKALIEKLDNVKIV